VLDEAWAKAHPLIVSGDAGERCEDGSCPA
jgi:hypothetical protein